MIFITQIEITDDYLGRSTPNPVGELRVTFRGNIFELKDIYDRIRADWESGEPFNGSMKPVPQKQLPKDQRALPEPKTYNCTSCGRPFLLTPPATVCDACTVR